MKISRIDYLFLFIMLAAGILFLGTADAQTGSLKKVKNLTKQVNDLNKSVRPGDPWTIKDIITPKELLQEMNSKDKKKRPVVLHIGFQFLYNQGHIPGSKFAGPASREEGIKELKSVTKSIPRGKEVVIYCGCCAWTECPNIHPGFKAMKRMGFKDVKILYLPQNFTKDWVNKGLPVTR